MDIRWYTSDPHYGHSNIIDFCGRPFASLEDMHETLIKNYNERVSPVDACLWLGDCFLTSPEQASQILHRLNGIKVLIRGNHDRSAASMARLGFALVLDKAVLNIGGKTVRAAHRPQDSEPASGEFKMCGHLHAPWRRRDNVLHVGVDAWGFAPAHITDLTALVLE